MEDFIKFLSARSSVYETLAFGFYKEADAKYIDLLKKMIPVFKAFTLIAENKHLQDGLKALDNFLSSKAAQDTESLATEFARLFLIKNQLQNIDGIILTESVYLSPSGLLMQKERDEVLEIYYNEGLGKSKEFKEMEDHLSAELVFLSRMSCDSSDELQNGSQDAARKKLITSRSFIEQHLYKWLPKAVNDIVKMTTSDYFKGLALTTLGIVDVDKIYLDDLNE